MLKLILWAVGRIGCACENSGLAGLLVYNRSFVRLEPAMAWSQASPNNYKAGCRAYIAHREQHLNGLMKATMRRVRERGEEDIPTILGERVVPENRHLSE